jgi:hypothetical protein
MPTRRCLVGIFVGGASRWDTEEERTASRRRCARSQRLIAGSTVAVDGSKIRAVASRKAIARQGDLAAQAQRNAQEIEHYLKLLDSQDSQEGGHSRNTGDVQQALKQLQIQAAAIQADLQRLAGGSSMVVQTEREAQVMHSLARRLFFCAWPAARGTGRSAVMFLPELL